MILDHPMHSAENVIISDHYHEVGYLYSTTTNINLTFNESITIIFPFPKNNKKQDHIP